MLGENPAMVRTKETAVQMGLPNPEPNGKSKRKHMSYYAALFTLIEMTCRQNIEDQSA